MPFDENWITGGGRSLHGRCVTCAYVGLQPSEYHERISNAFTSEASLAARLEGVPGHRFVCMKGVSPLSEEIAWGMGEISPVHAELAIDPKIMKEYGDQPHTSAQRSTFVCMTIERNCDQWKEHQSGIDPVTQYIHDRDERMHAESMRVNKRVHVLTGILMWLTIVITILTAVMTYRTFVPTSTTPTPIDMPPVSP